MLDSGSDTIRWKVLPTRYSVDRPSEAVSTKRRSVALLRRNLARGQRSLRRTLRRFPHVAGNRRTSPENDDRSQ